MSQDVFARTTPSLVPFSTVRLRRTVQRSSGPFQQAGVHAPDVARTLAKPSRVLDSEAG